MMNKNNVGKESVAETAPSEGQLTFDVDCGLLFQLGEELVSRRSVALAELVKNAYDADASQVLITLADVTAVGGAITIKDDGVGIPFQQIQDTWMRIATTEKERHPSSERFGRQRAGAKGIGRFATRRLARQLELVSVAYFDRKKSRGPKEETTVLFDWDSFTRGKEIQEIPVVYRRRIVEHDRQTGVTLRLKNVRDVWKAEDLAGC